MKSHRDRVFAKRGNGTRTCAERTHEGGSGAMSLQTERAGPRPPAPRLHGPRALVPDCWPLELRDNETAVPATQSVALCPEALAKSQHHPALTPQPEVCAVVQFLLKTSQKQRCGYRCFNWGDTPGGDFWGPHSVALAWQYLKKQSRQISIPMKSQAGAQAGRGPGGRVRHREGGVQRPPEDWTSAMPGASPDRPLGGQDTGALSADSTS